MLDLLTSLVDKSLALAEVSEKATRYGFLESVRHYARDRLRESGEEARTQQQHLAYFLALAEDAEPELMGADRAAWLDRLERRDNLRPPFHGPCPQAPTPPPDCVSPARSPTSGGYVGMSARAAVGFPACSPPLPETRVLPRAPKRATRPAYWRSPRTNVQPPRLSMKTPLPSRGN